MVELMVSVLLLFDEAVHTTVCVSVHGLICPVHWTVLYNMLNLKSFFLLFMSIRSLMTVFRTELFALTLEIPLL
jgi:hypothetical protein